MQLYKPSNLPFYQKTTNYQNIVKNNVLNPINTNSKICNLKGLI